MFNTTQSNNTPKVPSVVTTPKKTTHIQRLPTTLGSEEQLPRYLQYIVGTFKNSGDLWHIMTTVPDPETCNQKFVALEQYLIAYKEQLMRKVFPSKQKGERDYNSFSKDIHNALFDECGVYYTIQHRANLDTYTKHQAHALIIEAETGVCIKGANHLIKAEALFNRLNKFNGSLKSLVNACKDLTDEDVKSLAMDFQTYFEMQIQCLEVAINYHKDNFSINQSKLKSQESKASEVLKDITKEINTAPNELSSPSEIVQKWHGTKIYKRTPSKHDTPCLHTIVSNGVHAKNPRTLEIAKLAANELMTKRLKRRSEALTFSTGITPLLKRLAAPSSDTSPINEHSIKRHKVTPAVPLLEMSSEITPAFEEENFKLLPRKIIFGSP